MLRVTGAEKAVDPPGLTLHANAIGVTPMLVQRMPAYREKLAATADSVFFLVIFESYMHYSLNPWI